MYDTEQR